MPTPQLLLTDVLFPALVAAMVVLLGYGLAKGGRIRSELAIPLALAAGFCARFAGVTGAIPSISVLHAPGTLFYLGIYVAILTAAAMYLNGYLIKSIGTLLVLAASYSYVLNGRLRDSEMQADATGWILAFTAVGGLWCFVFTRAPREGADRVITPVVMALVSTFSAILLLMSYSVSYGRLGLALAGAASATLISGLLLKIPPAGAIAVAFTAMLGSLLLAGVNFAELKVSNLVLISVAPILLPLSKRLPGYQKRRPVTQWAWSLALVAVPLLVALATTVPAFVRSMDQE